jgi:hypothetical protein
VGEAAAPGWEAAAMRRAAAKRRGGISAAPSHGGGGGGEGTSACAAPLAFGPFVLAPSRKLSLDLKSVDMILRKHGGYLAFETAQFTPRAKPTPHGAAAAATAPAGVPLYSSPPHDAAATTATAPAGVPLRCRPSRLPLRSPPRFGSSCSGAWPPPPLLPRSSSSHSRPPRLPPRIPTNPYSSRPLACPHRRNLTHPRISSRRSGRGGAWSATATC